MSDFKKAMLMVEFIIVGLFVASAVLMGMSVQPGVGLYKAYEYGFWAGRFFAVGVLAEIGVLILVTIKSCIR